MAAKLSKAAHTPGLLLSPVCGLEGVGVGAAEAAGEDGHGQQQDDHMPFFHRMYLRRPPGADRPGSAFFFTV